MNENNSSAYNVKNKNYVYINPKFKNISHAISSSGVPFPHINPSFKNLNVPFNNEVCNYYGTSAHNLLYNKYNRSLSQPKIHVNPRLLSTLNATNQRREINSSTSYIESQPKNRFSKINPPKVGSNIKNTNKPNDQSLLLLSKPRKPSHSLVRKVNKTSNLSNTKVVFNEKLLLKPLFTKYTIKRVPLKNKEAKSKQKVKSKTLLKKVNIKLRKITPPNNTFNSNVVFVNGEKFSICDDKLKRLNLKSDPTSRTKICRRVCIKGKTFVRKSNNLYVLESKEKMSSRVLKKINITCPIYRRLGICNRHIKGKCSLLHDPKYISICRKFIHGECKIDGCHLSHNVIVEKMPACKYFLEGCCTKINCPYLHVKNNDDADVCVRFLEGFCEAAMNCNNIHINICPDFYKTGTCDRPKCQYPHKRISKIPAHMSAHLEQNNRKLTILDDKYAKTSKIEDATKRYYLDDLVEPIDCEKMDNGSVSNDSEKERSENRSAVAFCDRPKLCNLPSFIAL